ncbi:hypothetical protein PQ455_14315 [Sphingomonas naphthae]|uniref:Uncharacterized protein n=1 Tax=Sphingomonas naphthae TaxID=1813468 RepID=A0ABY7TIJ3_9SPHN|nr:hypothetical protein [Sphingomonas naphthae]WCT72801.1 hypothetical protein PQ455_14315 [Sphingomonas naphthae]
MATAFPTPPLPAPTQRGVGDIGGFTAMGSFGVVQEAAKAEMGLSDQLLGTLLTGLAQGTGCCSSRGCWRGSARPVRPALAIVGVAVSLVSVGAFALAARGAGRLRAPGRE